MFNWPVLSYEEAKDTYATLQLFTQVVGKIKLKSMPWINHSWHVALQVTSRGLTTGPLETSGKQFQLDFDFCDHALFVQVHPASVKKINLSGLSVSQFYNLLFQALSAYGIQIKIYAVPNELADPVPFAADNVHCTYNAQQVSNFHQALLESHIVLNKFRASFAGKSSPVHFFWGSFDLAVSLYSGRKAPEHPGGITNLPDRVVKEAYSHEVFSSGFWPGNELVPFAAYYCYMYPEPVGFSTFQPAVKDAFYHPVLKEFILPYEVVQKSADQEKVILEFLNSVYIAAADLAKWNRAALERSNEYLLASDKI